MQQRSARGQACVTSMPGTCQAWSATGRTPAARSVDNFSSSATGISSGGTISLLKVAVRLAAPAFPDGGIPHFDDRLQPVPSFRSCAPNQIFLAFYAASLQPAQRASRIGPKKEAM